MLLFSFIFNVFAVPAAAAAAAALHSQAGHFYVCGDAGAMAGSVEEELLRVSARGTLQAWLWPRLVPNLLAFGPKPRHFWFITWSSPRHFWFNTWLGYGTGSCF